IEGVAPLPAQVVALVADVEGWADAGNDVVDFIDRVEEDVVVVDGGDRDGGDEIVASGLCGRRRQHGGGGEDEASPYCRLRDDWRSAALYCSHPTFPPLMVGSGITTRGRPGCNRLPLPHSCAVD